MDNICDLNPMFAFAHNLHGSVTIRLGDPFLKNFSGNVLCLKTVTDNKRSARHNYK